MDGCGQWMVQGIMEEGTQEIYTVVQERDAPVSKASEWCWHNSCQDGMVRGRTH